MRQPNPNDERVETVHQVEVHDNTTSLSDFPRQDNNSPALPNQQSQANPAADNVRALPDPILDLDSVQIFA